MQARGPSGAAPDPADDDLALGLRGGEVVDTLGVEQRIAVVVEAHPRHLRVGPVGLRVPVDRARAAEVAAVVRREIGSVSLRVGAVREIEGRDVGGIDPRGEGDALRLERIDGGDTGVGSTLDDAVLDLDVISVEGRMQAIERLCDESGAEVRGLLRLQRHCTQRESRRGVDGELAARTGRRDIEVREVLLSERGRPEAVAYRRT